MRPDAHFDDLAPEPQTDPSKEPFASALTDQERLQLIGKLVSGDFSIEDVGILDVDMSRAQRKLVAALGQMRGEATIANPTFKEPDLSAQSAAWTSSAIWQPLSSLANTAAKFKLAQRARASKERAPDFNRVFIRLLNSKYEDHLNKELWDELISFNGDYGVEITEIFEPLRLTWADSEGRSGKLSFRTFENRLATLRGEIGRQKRPRKNSR